MFTTEYSDTGLDVIFTYDEGENGVGRLSGINNDQSTDNGLFGREPPCPDSHGDRQHRWEGHRQDYGHQHNDKNYEVMADFEYHALEMADGFCLRGQLGDFPKLALCTGYVYNGLGLSFAHDRSSKDRLGHLLLDRRRFLSQGGLVNFHLHANNPWSLWYDYPVPDRKP